MKKLKALRDITQVEKTKSKKKTHKQKKTINFLYENEGK